MSAEKLVKGLAERINRRTFLAKLGASAVAAMLGLMGLHATAEAVVSYKCCALCWSPSPSCSGCYCIWCWCCCYNGTKYACCECYDSSGACAGGCRGVNCSFAYSYSSC